MGGYYFLDLPGYGYAKAGQAQRREFGTLIARTLDRVRLAGGVWLLDVRRDPSPEDRVIQGLFAAKGTRVLAAVTKGDKLPRGPRAGRERELRETLRLDSDQLIMTSARAREGIPELKEAIGALVERRWNDGRLAGETVCLDSRRDARRRAPFQPANLATFCLRPGHPPRRLRHPQARRHRGPVRHRSARDPGPAARRAGDPVARPGYLPVARAAAQDQRARRRGRGAARRGRPPDPRHGDVLRPASPGALQPRGRERHEPRAAVPPGRDRAAVAALELVPAGRTRAGGRDLSLRRGHQLSRGHDGQLPGALQRLVDGRAAHARSRAGTRDGAGEPPAEAVGGSHALPRACRAAGRRRARLAVAPPHTAAPAQRAGPPAGGGRAQSTPVGAVFPPGALLHPLRLAPY